MFGQAKHKKRMRKSSKKVKQIRNHFALNVSCDFTKSKKEGYSFYFPSFSVLGKAILLLIITLVIIPGIYLVSELSFVFFTEEGLQVKSVEVLNNILFSGEEIKQAALIPQGANILDIKIAEIKERLEENKNIEQVVVLRKIPDTIQIKVYEKMPQLIAKSDGREYFIDQNGKILSWDKDRVTTFLPYVEGITIAGDSEVDDGTTDIFKSIVTILESYSELNKQELFMIDHIKVVNPYEILLFTKGQKNIRVTKNDNFQYIFLKLQEVVHDLEKRETIYNTIDLRFNDVVVI